MWESRIGAYHRRKKNEEPAKETILCVSIIQSSLYQSTNIRLAAINVYAKVFESTRSDGNCTRVITWNPFQSIRLSLHSPPSFDTKFCSFACVNACCSKHSGSIITDVFEIEMIYFWIWKSMCFVFCVCCQICTSHDLNSMIVNLLHFCRDSIAWCVVNGAGNVFISMHVCKILHVAFVCLI